jgi:hypothetical protein
MHQLGNSLFIMSSAPVFGSSGARETCRSLDRNSERSLSATTIATERAHVILAPMASIVDSTTSDAPKCTQFEQPKTTSPYLGHFGHGITRSKKEWRSLCKTITFAMQ